MNRFVLFLFAAFICLPLFGQAQLLKNDPGIHQGLLRGSATFSPAYDNFEWKYYVLGEAEYLLTDHVGLLGAVYVQVSSTEKDAALWLTDCCAFNDGQADYFAHNLFFGPKYHFLTDQPLDVYIGFTTGSDPVSCLGV